MGARTARDISYANCAETRAGRLIIRAMENATGRLGLIKRAHGYERDVESGGDFWEVMATRYGLSLDIAAGTLEHIPKTGPLIVTSNHPYGILDGLILGLILSRVRGDFKILANSVFQKAGALDPIILPVSFDPSKQAIQSNLQTRKAALEYLSQGGAIGVFPGGTVSTARSPLGKPRDPSWGAFTARLVRSSNAAVVPIYFQGQTSRLFQIASHLHSTLRLGLLIREFHARVDTPVRVSIGAPLQSAQIQARSKDARELMDFLRRSTYELSSDHCDASQYGLGFEQKTNAQGKS